MQTIQQVSVLIAFLAYALSADTIELKTGERIEGTFKEATSSGVVINVGGQSLTMPMDKVRAIYFGTDSKSVETTSLVRESIGVLKGLHQ